MAGRDGVGLMGRFRGGGGGGATAAAAAAVDLGAPNTRLLNRLNARLAADFEPAGIRYKRRLGQGGYGAVFLFEMVAERGVSHSVVVKASTREMLINADPFEDELANLNVSCDNGPRTVKRTPLLAIVPALECRVCMY